MPNPIHKALPWATAAGAGVFAAALITGQVGAGAAVTQPGAAPVVRPIHPPSSRPWHSSATASGEKPLPRGTTLVSAAYVTSVGTSSGGQDAVVVGIDIKNVDLADSPNSGLPVTAAANAANAITVVRLDPGHGYDKGNP